LTSNSYETPPKDKIRRRGFWLSGFRTSPSYFGSAAQISVTEPLKLCTAVKSPFWRNMSRPTYRLVDGAAGTLLGEISPGKRTNTLCPVAVLICSPLSVQHLMLSTEPFDFREKVEVSRHWSFSESIISNLENTSVLPFPADSVRTICPSLSTNVLSTRLSDGKTSIPNAKPAQATPASSLIAGQGTVWARDGDAEPRLIKRYCSRISELCA
jgi:hypothetical protein